MALKSLLFVSLLTLISLFADTSSTDAEFRGEAKAKITFLEKQNNELKIKLDSLEDKQKSVEEYQNIIDRQDKRIEDVNTKMSVAGAIVSFLAIIIGIGGVVFPIVLFRQNMKIQEQAKNDIELWKEKTKKEFDEELEKFKKHANAKTEEITKDAENAHQLLEIIENSHDVSQLNNNISSEEQELASNESQKLATKAKKTSSWKDYITSAKLSFFAKNYGDALRSINEALHELSKIVKDENTEEFVKEQLAQALFLKGITFGEMNKNEEEIKVYEELLHTFKETKNETIREQMARALFNKGFSLGQMNQNEEATKAYDELLHTFRETTNEAIKELIAKAFFNKGFSLGQMNQNEEEIKVYDELLHTFIETTNEAIKELIAKVLGNKGFRLGQMNQNEEAIKAYDELLRSFKETNNDAIKELMAKVQVNKGFILGQMNKSEEAIKVYDELLHTFKETTNEAIKEQMANALLNIFEYLLINNKEWSDENMRLFKEYTKNNQQLLLQFEMLQIVKNVLQKEQTYRREQLKQEFSDTNVGNWGWKELKTWAEKLEDAEAKKRVQQTIEAFENWNMK
jgi:hypothetical protein